MPRPRKGPRLYLRPPKRKAGVVISPARWVIRDGERDISTGLGPEADREAEQRLGDYLAEKHRAPRRERALSEIPIGDVIGVYIKDVIPGQARPEKAIERTKRLLAFFGEKYLDQISGELCRAYAEHREGKGASTKGTGGGARRDLQDLAAAINHHHQEGLHRASVRVVLPPRGKARKRWLTRSEAARLLWVCWRTREVQDGAATDKRPLRHLCRFLLLGLYTGSRPGAILNAAWFEGPGLSYVDLANGVFHRHASGEAETDKRQPTVKLAPRLASHLRRWSRMDAATSPRPIFVVAFNGQPIQSVKTALGRACALAELESGVSAYTLRHSCASWLVSKGVSTRKVAEFLGTSDQMVIAHYGHLDPEYQEEAVAALSRK